MTKTAERTKSRYVKKQKDDVKKKGQIDFTLLIVVLIMVGLGIIMVLSASSPTALAATGNSYSYVTTQIQAAALGIFLMIIISNVDYTKYKKLYKIAYWGSIIALLSVITPLGYSAGGAKRWIDLGFTTLQPSELAKIGLIIFYAGYLNQHKDEIKDFVNGFIKPVIWLAPVVLILVLIQDHLSATLIIVIVVAVIMVLAGSRIRYFITCGSLAGAGLIGGLLILAQKTGQGAFRFARIVSFLDPWKDAQDSGWQVIQGLYAIGTGGLFGVGLGESKQKYLYISEPQNDFIFAVLAEELGFARMCYCYLIICYIRMERNISSNKSTRHIWKFSSFRNNSVNWNSGNNEHSSCYIINASYRDIITIL